MRIVSGDFTAGILNGSGQRESCSGKKHWVNSSLLRKYSCPPTRIERKKWVSNPHPPGQKPISSSAATNTINSTGMTTSAKKRNSHLRRGDSDSAGSPGVFLFSDLRPAFDLFGRCFMIHFQKSRSNGLGS